MSKINTLDELVDQEIDYFFSIIEPDIKANKYTLDTITKLITQYKTEFPKSEFYKGLILLLGNEENVKIIEQIIFDYLHYYTIVWFIILDTKKSVWSDRFTLTTEKTSKIMNLSEIVGLLVELFKSPPDQIVNIVKNNLEKYNKTLDILNMFSTEFIEQNLRGNAPDKKHNLIKTIIFAQYYLLEDKRKTVKILYLQELNKLPTKYIDTFVSNIETIDYATLESLFSKKDIQNGLVNDLYQLISQDNTAKALSAENKIKFLFENKVIVPITQEFLRYHKDVERALDVIQTEGKADKDNTRIKYIIGKLNNIINFYSYAVQNDQTQKRELEKFFPSSLAYLRAVLYNDLEEVNIIEKLFLAGRSAVYNSEYLPDLLTYRRYPYINFKNIFGYGFNYIGHRTIENIRDVNVANRYNPTYTDLLSKQIFTRVSNANGSINVVGVAVNTNRGRNLLCNKLYTLQDVRQIKMKTNEQTQNGYLQTLAIVNEMLNGNKIPKTNVAAWIFDLNKDNVTQSTYQENTSAAEDNSQLLVSQLYDDIKELVTKKIFAMLQSSKQSTSTIYELFMNVEQFLKTHFPLSQHDSFYDQIKYIIYFNRDDLTDPVEVDPHDLKLYGLVDPIMLPSINKLQKKRKAIKLFTDETVVEVAKDVLEDVVCQHYLDWESIKGQEMRNQTRFSQLLVDFVKKYSKTSENSEYLCKSCGQMLEIKKYVTDVSYADQETYIINVTSMTPLEEMPEYEKYNKSVANMEKIIERIAYVGGVTYLVGSTSQIKMRRQGILKEMLDMLLIHSKMIKKMKPDEIKERRENAQKNYGISQELSQFFGFDMDNDVFVFTSKEKDKFKAIKVNNILVYLLFGIILDLNATQLLNFNFDKSMSFFIFEKFGIRLFDGIYLRHNASIEAAEITAFPLLCYTIFYFSYMLLRYKLWNLIDDTPVDKNNVNPQLQKIIIHTLVDFINSLVETNLNVKNRDFRYELLMTKYFVKLNTVYNDNRVIERLREKEAKKISFDAKEKKIKFKTIVHDGLKVTAKTANEEVPYDPRRTSDKLLKLLPFTTIEDKTDFLGRTVKIKDDGTMPVGVKKLVSKKREYFYTYVTKLCQQKKEQNEPLPEICSLVENKSLDDMDDATMKQLEKWILTQKKDEYNKFRQQSNQGVEVNIMKNQAKLEKLVDELITKKMVSMDMSLNVFNKKLKDILGNDNTSINMTRRYLLDHDYLGTSMKPYLVESVTFKPYDEVTKTAVFVYTPPKTAISVYYNAMRLNMIGYKELKNDFVKTSNNNFLTVHPTFSEHLSILGYGHLYVDLQPRLIQYNQQFGTNETIHNVDFITYVVENFIRDRTAILKVFVKEIKQTFYSLKQHSVEVLKTMPTTQRKLVEKYGTKLQNIVLDNADYSFMKYSGTISDSIFMTKVTLEQIKSNFKEIKNFINVWDINKLNNADVRMVLYIIHEMTTLLDNNPDKYIQSVIIALFHDLVMHLFVNNAVLNGLKPKFEMYKFHYLITAETYYVDTDTGDFEEEPESEEVQKEREDAEEEADAMDIDMAEMDHNDDSGDADYMNTGDEH